MWLSLQGGHMIRMGVKAYRWRKSMTRGIHGGVPITYRADSVDHPGGRS
jgi:hypothetical protein